MPEYLDSNLLEEAVMRNERNNAFHKVIFLDVDGVLHDFTNNNQLQSARFALVKEIVDATNAELVLSSSWRFGYRTFLEENNLLEFASDHESETIKDFENFLHQYDLQISAFTPYSSLNENGRPLEIRKFLLDKRNLKSFVILDDGEYNWQWLRAFLVQTTQIINGKTVFGLEKFHAERAIQILNQFD